MIVSAYYVKNKEELILTTTKSFDKINEKENEVIFEKENEVVAINIFNYKNEKINSTIVKHEHIKEILEKYFEKYENPYEVGKIIEVEKHPKSEKLNICQVQLKEKIIQIVCGASNVEIGIKVIVAKVGTVMINGQKIEESKVIDIQSQGMICSYKELGIEDNSEGIAIVENEIGNEYYKGEI